MSTSQRVYQVTLAPGQIQNVPNGEYEFVFVRTATRPVGVTVEGQTIEMEAGEKRRFIQPMKNIIIFNPDPARELFVQLVVGLGDYEKLIVEGEILNAGGIKRASGEYVTDRRYWLPLNLYVADNYTPEYWKLGDYAGADDTGLPMENSVSFSAGQGGLEGHLLLPNGSGDAYYYRVDPADWSVVDSNFYLNKSGGLYTADHAAWDGEAFWGSVQSGRIMKKTNAGGQYSVVITVGQTIGVIGASAAAKKVAVRLYGEDTIRIYHGDSFEFIKDLAITGVPINNVFKETIIIEKDDDGVEKLWLLCATGGGTVSTYIYNIETGALIDSTTQSGITDDYVGVFQYGGLIGDFVMVVDSQSGHAKTQRVYSFAKREIDRRAKGGATLAGVGGPLTRARCPRLMKPAETLGFITESDVTTDPVADTITGELIKASLEMYLKRELAPDYLDHIFGLRIYTPGAGETWPYREILTGGKSFMLALQPDYFTSSYPARIDIMLDEGVINEDLD